MTRKGFNGLPHVYRITIANSELDQITDFLNRRGLSATIWMTRGLNQWALAKGRAFEPTVAIEIAALDWELVQRAMIELISILGEECLYFTQYELHFLPIQAQMGNSELSQMRLAAKKTERWSPEPRKVKKLKRA